MGRGRDIESKPLAAPRTCLLPTLLAGVGRYDEMTECVMLSVLSRFKWLMRSCWSGLGTLTTCCHTNAWRCLS